MYMCIGSIDFIGFARLTFCTVSLSLFFLIQSFVVTPSLRKLKLDYLDLYLIHWPVSAKPDSDIFPMKKEDFLRMDFKGVWADMEECQSKGLTKCVGVSNFSSKKVGDILANAKIPPAINQVSISRMLWIDI